MAIDPSIFAQANKPAVAMADPMQQLQQAASAQNAVNQNRLFQGQVAAGQAYQQATGPDGTLDVNRLRSLIAADPTAAPAAAATNESAQGLNVSQQGVALRNLAAQSSALDSLSSLNGGQGPSHAQVVQQIQMGLSQGWLQPHNAAAVLTGMPEGDDPQSMATRQHMVQTMGQQASTAQERLQNLYGTPVDVSNGQQNQPSMRAGMLAPNRFAVVPTGQATPIYPPRESLLAQVPGMDPRTGQPVARPMAAQAALQGVGNLTGPAGAMPPPTTPGDGRYPTPSPMAGIPTGLPPQQAATNEADTKLYRDGLNDVPQAQTRVQSLQKAQHALELALTGPGAGNIQKIRAFINTFSPQQADAVGNAPEAVQFALANKYLTGYASQQQNAGRSDAQLVASEGSNANVGIPTQAALDVVKTNIGRERQRIAQVQSHTDPTGIGYGQFASGFSSSTDPRAFAWDTYTPAERSSIEKGLDQAGLNKLDRSLAVAGRLHLIQVPGAQ